MAWSSSVWTWRLNLFDPFYLANCERSSWWIQITCEVCTKILSIFLSPEFKMHVELGNFKEVFLTTTCFVHPGMLKSEKIDKYGIKSNLKFWIQPWKSGNVLAKASGISPIPGMTTRLFVSNNLCLLLPPYPTNQLYNGKMLDPNWMNSNRFRI